MTIRNRSVVVGAVTLVGMLVGMLVGGCPPPGPPAVPAPSGEILANHLSSGTVRCGARTGVTSLPPGQVDTSPVLIRYQHHVGAAFRLQSLRHTLNGVTLCNLGLERSRALEIGPRALTVFRGRLPVGGYEIRQRALYRGHGVGVFSYMKGYKYRVAGGGRFTVRVGTPLCVDVYSLERRASSLAKRLKVRLRVEPNCSVLLRPARVPISPSH